MLSYHYHQHDEQSERLQKLKNPAKLVGIESNDCVHITESIGNGMKNT